MLSQGSLGSLLNGLVLISLGVNGLKVPGTGKTAEGILQLAHTHRFSKVIVHADILATRAL